MKDNYYEKLEFHRILELLSECSTTYLGKKLSLELLPIYKNDRVLKLLQETSEASLIIMRKRKSSYCTYP